jgi:hypothetical protein
MDTFRSKSKKTRDPLTARERQVLQLIADGKSTKDVPSLPGISVKTANLPARDSCKSWISTRTPAFCGTRVRRGIMQPDLWHSSPIQRLLHPALELPDEIGFIQAGILSVERSQHLSRCTDACGLYPSAMKSLRCRTAKALLENADNSVHLIYRQSVKNGCVQGGRKSSPPENHAASHAHR